MNDRWKYGIARKIAKIWLFFAALGLVGVIALVFIGMYRMDPNAAFIVLGLVVGIPLTVWALTELEQ